MKKLRRLKKREVLKKVLKALKKGMAGLGLGFALRSGPRNPNAGFFHNSGQTNQQLEAKNSDQLMMKKERQSRSVNSIQVKTGSGAIIKVRNNAGTIYNSFNSESEYNSLMGQGNDLILAFRPGKVLIYYEVQVDENNNSRRNADLRIIKEDKNGLMDVTASIPEERVLAKFYQIKSFGVRVPNRINLFFARNVPTKPRLDYLKDQGTYPTLRKAYIAFMNFLEDPKTDIFFGEFGEKYSKKDPNIKVYYGFYALNLKTKNMMFFQEEEDTGKYILHSYMGLSRKKAVQLAKTHKLFN